MQPPPNIPTQFNVGNYDICRYWGLPDWASALSIRSAILRRWKTIIDCNDSTFEFSTIAKSEVRGFISTLIEKPDSTLQLKTLLPPSDPPIRDQTISEFFSSIELAQTIDNANRYRKLGIPAIGGTEPHEEWLSKYRESSTFRHYMIDTSLGEAPQEGLSKRERRATTDSINSIMNSEKLVNETPSWKMHQASDNFDGRFMISVDLGTSDNDLLDAFKYWLKETRKTAKLRPMRRQFKEEDFATWHKNRYLPYIDLHIWSQIHDNKLSHNDIGVAIFGHYDNRGLSDNIRKTTAKNALLLIKSETISCLNYQLNLTTD